MTREIPLSQGKVALVDDEDYERLSGARWSAFIQPCHHSWYAASTNFHGSRVRMHRAILDAPSGMEVDHINGDGLDNRKSNLRLATRAQNGCNLRPQQGKSSRFKGVAWHVCGKWRAYISPNRTQIALGLFDDEIDAALAYDMAALAQFGEFARPNFLKVV